MHQAYISFNYFWAITTFFAGSIGLFQYDIKRVIAFSTCSQLGYLFLICGLSQYALTFFHLFNHAFFKALLFLCAGVIIHALHNEQDIRKMGGLLHYLPITTLSFIIASAALIAIPFFSGFYSKDIILETITYKVVISAPFLNFLSLFSVWSTTFYSFRLFYYTFWCEPNFRLSPSLLFETFDIMTLLLFILAFFSLFVGYITKDIMIGSGTTFWQDSIATFYNTPVLENELITSFNKYWALFFILSACFTFYALHCDFINNDYPRALSLPFFRKWWFDIVYNKLLLLNITFYYFLFYKLLDKGFLEGFILRITHFCQILSLTFSRLQTGFLYHYFFLIFFFICFLVIVACYQFTFSLLDISFLFMLILFFIINQ